MKGKTEALPHFGPAVPNAGINCFQSVSELSKLETLTLSLRVAAEIHRDIFAPN